jgi:RNA polymerase sigma-70 factor (ECF subfamily)
VKAHAAIEPEQLLAHAGWMHALAARLLADPTAADDVVQDAWIAALRYAPSTEKPLEPWLARAVRNFAWKRRRSDVRRAEHEQRAATPEPVVTPDHTAERIERQRVLVDAVAALDEPFRTTLVLHYFEGQTSAEIARTQRVPAGTVRWRLKRGLDELRARLDARFGSRATWSAMFAPFAARFEPAATATVGVSTATATGVFAMSMALKLVAAAGVLAAAGLWWLSTGDEGRAAEPRVEHAAAPALQDPAPVASGTSADAIEIARASVASQPEPEVAKESPTAPEPPRAPARTAWVSARFVDARGAPWKGVSFTCRGQAAGASSAADGRARLEVALYGDSAEVSVNLVAKRAGCATKSMAATLPVARETNLGDVVLAPGSRVSGRVVDDGGRAREGAYVGLARAELSDDDEAHLRRQGDDSFDRVVQVVSERDGAFALDGVPTGQWRLYGKADDSRYGWTEPFDVREGVDVFGVELNVPAMLDTDRITGVVLDPHGEPVPHARMNHTYQSRSEAGSVGGTSDEDGRFDVVIQRDTSYDFFASDPDNRYVAAIARNVEPGTRGLELRLGEKSFFAVRVRDREGRPVEGCTFRVIFGTHFNEIAGDSQASVVEPGTYRLARPPMEFNLSVAANGFKPSDETRLAPPADGASHEVVLEHARLVRGRVTADGKPLAGARLQLHGERAEGHIEINGFPCRFDPTSRANTTSNADGEFELGCDVEGPIWLRATAAGWAGALLGPLEPSHASSEPLEIELTQGGAIEGRVLLPEGRNATGTIVGVTCGDGAARTMRAGTDGLFHFDGLTPGRWRVISTSREIRPDSVVTASFDTPGPHDWPCVVVAGETAHFDLDLSDQ